MFRRDFTSARPTQEINWKVTLFVYGTFTLCSCPFQVHSTKQSLCNFLYVIHTYAFTLNPVFIPCTRWFWRNKSSKPNGPSSVSKCIKQFGLFPVRSPLLRECCCYAALFSFLLGTKMFQFPSLPPYCKQHSLYLKDKGVSPFGHLRIIGCLGPSRSFSHPTTSFIGFMSLGIHHILLRILLSDF